MSGNGYDLPRFQVRTAREIMELPDPPPEHALLGPLVYRGHRTIIVGDTGHGKTSLALRMLGAIVRGEPMIGYDGAGVGPVLVLDLEQGIKSIKRGVREAVLADRDDVLYVTAPDGLALDQDETHLAALNAVLEDYRPVALLLDPYYKAHQADDPNAERPIIDLMRRLDALRVVHEFALLLPAHPRKEPAGQFGARKLTIHDIAGSGAATRGAEVVVALERLGQGFARLRYLKDRDGELPVGESITLLYDAEHGYRLDPRSVVTDEQLEERIAETSLGWMTAKEWAVELKAREARVRSVLAALAERDPPAVAFAVGPPGRQSNARCYATDPSLRDLSGSPTQPLFGAVGDPGDPTLSLERGVPGSPAEPLVSRISGRDHPDEEEMF